MPPSSSGGALHDEMWCRAAMQHMQMLVELRVASHEPPAVVSMGPRLSRTKDDLVVALSTLVNAEPPTRNISDSTPADPSELIDFNFEAGETPGVIAVDSSMDAAPMPLAAKAKALVFFTVQKMKPSRVKVPKLAATLPDTAVAVNLQEVFAWDQRQRVATVLVESTGGQACQPHILNPSLLTVDDFASMAIWADKQLVAFDVGGFKVEAEWEAPFQQLVSALMQNIETDVGSSYVHIHGLADAPRQSACLEALAARGFVRCISADTGKSSWVMTEQGLKATRLIRRLHKPVRLLSVRPGVELRDATAWELVSMLQSQGWVCSVLGVRRRAARVRRPGMVEAPTPCDFVAGQEKRWWIHHRQTAFQPSYLRALLSAESIGKPIAHLRSQAYYEDLLAGREPARRGAKRFRIHAGDDGIVPEPRRRVQRRRLAVSSRAGFADRESKAAGSDSSALDLGAANVGSASDGASSGSGSSGAGSAASRSSAASSASSSSSSTTSSGSHRVDAAIEDHGVVGAPSDAGLEVVAARARAGASGGLRIDTTIPWKTFKFTEVKESKEGEKVCVGYEVTCYIECHRTQSGGRAGRCTRTLRFARHGGRMETIQKLRWWAISGFALPSKQLHQQLPFEPPSGLPTMEELEAFEVPDAHFESLPSRLATS